MIRVAGNVVDTNVVGSIEYAVKHLGANKYYPAMAAAVNLIRLEQQRTKKPVKEYKIRQMLEKEVPPFLAVQILDSLIASRRITVLPGTDVPNRELMIYGSSTS